MAGTKRMSAGTKRIAGAAQASQTTEGILLDVMRHLNLAVAVVAGAREKQREGEDSKLMIEDALIHVRGAVTGLEQAQKSLPRKKS
jgi:hypothetical protein